MPTTTRRTASTRSTRGAASRRPSTGRPATKRKRAAAERIIRDLSIHAAIEEELLYPAARKRLRNGAALVNEAKTEHRQLKKLLDRLDKMDADDPRADETMAAVRRAVQQHVEEEEGTGGILQGLRKARPTSRTPRTTRSRATRSR